MTPAQTAALALLEGDYTLHQIGPNGSCEPGMPMSGGFRGLREWNGTTFAEVNWKAPADSVFKPGALLALPTPRGRK